MGIGFPVALVAGGAAVDYSKAVQYRTALQHATDAAVLAAAALAKQSPTAGDSAYIDAAKKTFEANALSLRLAARPPQSAVAINAGAISVRATGLAQMSFMSILGMPELEVTAYSESGLGSGGAASFAAEIVLVLDNSSSMSSSSHAAMVTASKAVVNEFTNKLTNTNVKIGLVPFSKYIYATIPGQYVMGGTPGFAWTNCTGDRRYPYNTDNSLPTLANIASQWGRTNGNDTVGTDEYVDCPAEASANLQVRRLSTDFAGVLNQIGLMATNYGTNIFVGMQFAFHLLTPNGMWNDAGPFGTKKIVFLLTDGRQHTYGFGPDGSYSKEGAIASMQILCTNMKAKGITIVAIAYDIDDPLGKEDLRTCASEGQYYGEKFYLEATASNISSVMTAAANSIITGSVMGTGVVKLAR